MPPRSITQLDVDLQSLRATIQATFPKAQVEFANTLADRMLTPVMVELYKPNDPTANAGALLIMSCLLEKLTVEMYKVS